VSRLPASRNIIFEAKLTLYALLACERFRLGGGFVVVMNNIDESDSVSTSGGSQMPVPNEANLLEWTDVLLQLWWQLISHGLAYKTDQGISRLYSTSPKTCQCMIT